MIEKSSQKDEKTFDDIENASIKIKSYMCFGESPQGFDLIKPINIIIGRNNSGKSRLLDLIEYIIDPSKLKDKSLNGKKSEILLTLPLLDTELQNVFKKGRGGGPLLEGDHWDFGKNFVGKLITLSIGESERYFISTDPALGLRSPNDFEKDLATGVRNPFQDKRFRKIQAERDIEPNGSSDKRDVLKNGDGATNNIDLFINNSKYPRELVVETLLKDLNSIVEPDVHFAEITVRRVKDESTWEVFLRESEKGYIPLSESGSGLKTILLVLINILLIPAKEKISTEKYIFAFEELENNLHPAIQRRLFAYIRNIALDKKAHFFITTHSNIVIDLFSKDPHAQICHVIHDGKESSVRSVKTYVDLYGILDDLDIRASDLLQSNGIIWVEGPSDRIYINRFIELWTNGSLKEGQNYQCVFYGGRILAHLSAEIPEDNKRDLLKIFFTNRNAIILMDSDKKDEADDINSTKKRIIDEITNAGGKYWVTKGKTIENYISPKAVASMYQLKGEPDLDQYKDFREYLEEIKQDESKRFERNKVTFAEKIRPHLNQEDLANRFDLSERLDEIINIIKSWNNIK